MNLSYISISWHLNYKEVVEIIATYIVQDSFEEDFSFFYSLKQRPHT